MEIFLLKIKQKMKPFIVFVVNMLIFVRFLKVKY